MPACVAAQVLESQRRLVKGKDLDMASIRKRIWSSGGEEKTAWVADYFDQDGKRHIKTFKQRKEADAWLVAARREVQQGTHTPASSKTTVSEAGEMWLAEAE